MVPVSQTSIHEEVFVRLLVCMCVVALSTTGCLSTTTVQARRDAEAGLARPPWTGGAAPPQATGSSATADVSTCEGLARTIVASHPRLRAARARARAALARSRAEGSLPPPHASIEVWDFPIGDPSRADREGMYMLGVGQEFPAPGARDNRSLAEAEEARVALAELSDAGRELWAQARHACANWSAAEAVRSRLSSYRALLGESREAMIARYQTGGETLGIVSRADAELAAADRHVAEAEEEVLVARATLSALAGEEVAIPPSIPALETTNTAVDLDRLLALALSSRGDVSAADARRRSADARAAAATAEANAPSFEVRATYMQTPSMRAGLGAMFSMSLPWLWGGASDRRDSAQHEVEAARADASDVNRTVRVEVTRAAGQLRALGRALEILVEREIPAAQRALEAERAGLVAGDFNLASWIQAAHALREAHVDEARVRGALEHTRIDLEMSVGRPLAPAATRTEVQP